MDEAIEIITIALEQGTWRVLALFYILKAFRKFLDAVKQTLDKGGEKEQW